MKKKKAFLGFLCFLCVKNILNKEGFVPAIYFSHRGNEDNEVFSLWTGSTKFT
jgi:hypothetical protein